MFKMLKMICREDKLRVALLLASQLFYDILAIGVAFLLSFSIDTVSTVIATGELMALLWCGAVCFAYAVLTGFAACFYGIIKASAVRKIMLRLRRHTADGILAQDISAGQSVNSADSLTLMGHGMETLEENALRNGLEICDSIIKMILACAFLIYINPLIAVFSLIVTAIPCFIAKLFAKEPERCQEKIMAASSAYNARIRDMLQGFAVIKDFQIEQQEASLHSDAADRLEREKNALGNVMAKINGISNAAGIFAQFLILLFSGLFAASGLITLGNIVAVTQLSGQVIYPAFGLSEKLGKLKAALPVFSQMQTMTEITQTHASATIIEMKQSIRLDNISFSYGEAAVADNLSAQFDFGKSYAITGKSGCGKSTLLKLIGGHYTPDSGHITIDGRTDASCASVFIHQDVFLFDDTVRNNITLYGSFSEDALMQAVRLSGLEQFIHSLPDGLDTQAGENGSRFSGGERQRIAIARALLHQKTLFLIDEATSALDGETARQIENTLLNLENITLIAVTHHLDEAQSAKYDRIFSMRAGKLTY